MKRVTTCESQHPQTGLRCWSRKHEDDQHWAVQPAVNNGKVNKIFWTTTAARP